MITVSGIDASGGDDVSSQVQNIVDAAQGDEIVFPPGTFKCTGIVSTKPMNIRGSGNGAGPGPGAHAQTGCTRFLLPSATAWLFNVTAKQGSVFRDFMVLSNPPVRPMTAGGGIRLTAAGTDTVANYKIENVAFTNLHRAVYVTKPAWGTITGCYVDDWQLSGLHFDTIPGVEGSAGFINGNYIFGFDGTHGHAIYSEVGYAIIDSNEVLGGDIGIKFALKNFNAGFIKIKDSTIENYDVIGVDISSQDGSTAAFVMLTGLELQSQSTPSFGIVVREYAPSPGWTKDTRISGNIVVQATAANGKHIWVQDAWNAIISENLMEEQAANGGVVGLQVTGSTTSAGIRSPTQVLDNSFIGQFAQRYNLSSGVFKRDNLGY